LNFFSNRIIIESSSFFYDSGGNMTVKTVKNFINGKWIESESKEILDVRNPATAEVIAKVPLSTKTEVDSAVQSALSAFKAWRETPPLERVRKLFHLKFLLEKNFEELSKIVVTEAGKTIHEARGEVRRLIENVEVATGIPSLMMGYGLEDIARSIDCEAVRQPVGVFCCIAPFNFPAMVPFWFMPFALACGNTYIVKPSEQDPLSQEMCFSLMNDADFPEGTVNLVNGAVDVVNELLNHPKIAGVSFVGSSPVAKHVYKTAGATGKRVQALGGAKNFIIVMPDASMDHAVSAIAESCFGCAGQRCLAGAVILTVGDIHETFREKFVAESKKMKIGNPMDETTQMGPVISKKSRDRVISYISRGIEQGAELILDGRTVKIPGFENGYFIGPTIFDKARPEMAIAQEEIFGPFACLMNVKDMNQGLKILTEHELGNATSIFTTSGKAAREFKYRALASMMGINIGVAAPMAFFTFGGAKGSFFGDLKGHGRDSIEFFTDKKVVISRWY
jgi:malonate-semialdehyde dehydrogenase (acetylating)/methylmalonate-semialdehyde dehydrogenase